MTGRRASARATLAASAAGVFIWLGLSGPGHRVERGAAGRVTGEPEPAAAREARRAFEAGVRWRRANLASTHPRALDSFLEAARLEERAGDIPRQAVALSHAGLVQMRLDRRRAAVATQERALELLTAVPEPDPAMAAQVRHHAALAYLAVDTLQPALERSREAVALARRAADPLLLASALTALGRSLHALGQFPRAREALEEALAIQREWAGAHPEDPRPPDQAAVLLRLGLSYQQPGQPGPAQLRYQEALALCRSARDRHCEAQALNRLVSVVADKRRAIEYGERALALNRPFGDSETEATTLHNMSGADQAVGELDRAQELNDAALTIRRRIDTPIGICASLNRASLLAEKRGRMAEAVALLEESVRIVEDIRRGIADPALRVSFFDMSEPRFEDLVGLLLRADRRQPAAGHAARAFDAVERTRARTLLEDLPGPPGRSPGGADAKPRRLAEVQREVLDADTLLLQYYLGRSRSTLFVVSGDRSWWFELPPTARIDSQANLVYGHLTARERRQPFETRDEREERCRKDDADLEQAAAELSRMVLAPAAPYLPGKRLLVAPDGALHYVRFEMLPNPRSLRRPLILDHEISYLASASILARQRRDLAGRAAPLGTILMLADPVFGVEDERVGRLDARFAEAEPAPESPASLPRLPHTGREAAAVEALVPEPRRRIVTGFEANRAVARGPEPGRYQVLHFASHALLDDASPDQSGIQLSSVDRRGRRVEGLLRAAEIRDLKLAADLVVLSTCTSGLGKRAWGEGLMSLTRAFFHAGAARVLVSLWKVDDEATATLMKHFHTALFRRGLGPLAALRAAQLALRTDPRWRAPYYWAAFGLHGEYRDVRLQGDVPADPVATSRPAIRAAAGTRPRAR